MANVRRDDEEEMSIEEILSSIRRYVGDESAASSSSVHGTSEQTAQVLASSLSGNRVEENPSAPIHSPAPERSEKVVRLSEAYAIKPEKVLKMEPSPVVENQEEEEEGQLLSPQVQTVTTQSFAKLAEIASHVKEVSVKSQPALTLEQLVTELARPMIKQWLDQNLPRLVELVVAKEVERLTRSMRSE